MLTVVAVAAIPASAQAVLAPELKAAYLYNFARFVEWPADLMPAGAPLALCVANDNAVADALDVTVRGRYRHRRNGRYVCLFNYRRGRCLGA